MYVYLYIYIYMYINIYSAHVINRTSPRDATRPARHVTATAAHYLYSTTAGSERQSPGGRRGVKDVVWGVEDGGDKVKRFGFEDEFPVVCC